MNEPAICYCCAATGVFSILVANSDRLYLPNQSIRALGDHHEIWFCRTCMRAVEDAFRASILYLKHENGAR